MGLLSLEPNVCIEMYLSRPVVGQGEGKRSHGCLETGPINLAVLCERHRGVTGDQAPFTHENSL